MMEELKPYNISSEYSEYGTIIFATSYGQAKTAAIHTDQFDDDRYIDLRARIDHRFDEYAKGKRNGQEFDFCGNADIFHKVGGYCVEPGYCDKTGCIFKHESMESEAQ